MVVPGCVGHLLAPNNNVLLAMFTVLALGNRRCTVLVTSMVFLVPVAFAELLKNLVDRSRTLKMFVVAERGAFPSGHVSATAACSWMLEEKRLSNCAP